MMKRRTFNRSALSFAALAAGGFASAPLQAQDWPDKPVRLILSQPAGSGPDNIARLLAERLQHAWGQAIVVDNKPGGQNTIGAIAAARSVPDGGTFYLATTAALVTNSYLFKTLAYDPRRDFTPVGFVGRSPFAILVDAKSPLQSLNDLVARAKAEPGAVKVATEGPRTFGGLIARLFNARAKIDTNLASYASVGTATQDTLGGHVDVLVADLASTAALVRQGRLRVLAVTTPKRLEGYEAVPALAESLPGFDMVGWIAIVAPAGTPAAAVQRFNRDLNAALNDKAMAARIHDVGPVADGSMTPQQFGAFLGAEHERWALLSAELGVLPE